MFKFLINNNKEFNKRGFMNIFLHFKSGIPYNLYIDGEYVCNNKTSIDVLMKSNEFTYTIVPYAAGENYYTDSGRVYVENGKVFATSQNLEIIPFKDDHYDIYFKGVLIKNYMESQVILQEEQGDIVVNVYNDGQGVVEMLNKAKLIIRKAITKIKTAQVDCVNNVLILKCLLENASYYILLLDMKDNKVLFEEQCDSVEVNDCCVKALKIINDISNHALVNEYDIYKLLASEYFVYVNKYNIIDTERLLPMQFIECLMYKDFKIAKSCLSNNFNDVTQEQLLNYFGDVKAVYYNSYCKDNVNYTIKTDTFKNYDFILSDGKIDDIKEVKLQ